VPQGSRRRSRTLFLLPQFERSCSQCQYSSAISFLDCARSDVIGTSLSATPNRKFVARDERPIRFGFGFMRAAESSPSVRSGLSERIAARSAAHYTGFCNLAKYLPQATMLLGFLLPSEPPCSL